MVENPFEARHGSKDQIQKMPPDHLRTVNEKIQLPPGTRDIHPCALLKRQSDSVNTLQHLCEAAQSRSAILLASELCKADATTATMHHLVVTHLGLNPHDQSLPVLYRLH
mmetsp:Transcript_45221/g.76182  ORF Transcript_45221/g.76182 Transcript_45221/m.76182 type:complete len:110 (+) Transcript_45221:869-1198(+)